MISFEPVVLLSVSSSFIAMSTLTVLTVSLLSSVFMVSPTPFWLTVDLISGTCFSVVGGYSAAELALYFGGSPQNSVDSVFGLACFVALMTGMCAFASLFNRKGDTQPAWFHATMLVTSNIGIMKGASLALGSSVALLGTPVFPLANYASSIL